MALSVPVDQNARARFSGRVQRLVGRPWVWLVFVAIALAVPILNQVRRHATPPLPVLGTLPSFKLVDQEGRPFGSDDLKGYVWMAGFIFTRCPTICPTITATMGKIQHGARDIEQGFRLVSFSVDPDYDTPARLTEYGHRFRTNPRMWKLLTGSFENIRGTVVDGLKIAMGEPVGDSDFASVFHGTHFVLVDQSLQIRGYYDSSSPDAVDRVLRDAATLINRGD